MSNHRCPDCQDQLQDVREVGRSNGMAEAMWGGDCDRCNEFHTVTPRRYDPLARLRAGDWKAYGCETPGCDDDHATTT